MIELKVDSVDFWLKPPSSVSTPISTPLHSIVPQNVALFCALLQLCEHSNLESLRSKHPISNRACSLSFLAPKIPKLMVFFFSYYPQDKDECALGTSGCDQQFGYCLDGWSPLLSFTCACYSGYAFNTSGYCIGTSFSPSNNAS
jgi:hypothetical protein